MVQKMQAVATIQEAIKINIEITKGTGTSF